MQILAGRKDEGLREAVRATELEPVKTSPSAEADSSSISRRPICRGGNGQSHRHARAAAEKPLLRDSGLAQGRSDLRFAAPEPALPEARRGQVAPAGAVPHRSFWLQEVEGDAPDAPPLSGRPRADVAILGGGYVGLWTAIRIKALEPSRRRRGARAGHLRRRRVRAQRRIRCSRGGRSSPRSSRCAARGRPRASLAAPRPRSARSGDFCAAHGIDAHFRAGGLDLDGDTTAQMGSWDGVLAARREARRRAVPPPRAGRGRAPHGLAGASRRRVRSDAATVQPASLARGLRRAALASGVRIYEHTRVRVVLARTAGRSSGPTAGG